MLPTSLAGAQGATPGPQGVGVYIGRATTGGGPDGITNGITVTQRRRAAENYGLEVMESAISQVVRSLLVGETATGGRSQRKH